MKYRRLEHRFVHYIPKQLEPGVLYVSIDFATAAHSCCCGCGEEVVTPITPHDWQMTFDGESVSLSPSIGNWHYRCQSHYVVRRNRVIEARPWSDDEIAAGRRKDKAVKASFYSDRSHSSRGKIAAETEQESRKKRFCDRLAGWFRKRQR